MQADDLLPWSLSVQHQACFTFVRLSKVLSNFSDDSPFQKGSKRSRVCERSSRMWRYGARTLMTVGPFCAVDRCAQAGRGATSLEPQPG